MIRLWTFLLAALACTAQEPAAGSVRGSVRNSVTGEPLRKAEVTLRSVPANVDTRPFAVETDASGQFHFPSVPTGSYLLTARRIGFLPAENVPRRQAPKAVTVAAGQEVDGVAIELIPNSVISGRVTDEDGEAMFGATVTLLEQKFLRGRRVLYSRGSAAVNDLGEYRIPALPAGRYLLVITAAAEFGPSPIRVRTPGQESARSYVPMYFPGVIDAASATVLELPPGQELRGIDVTLRRVPVVSVRGRAVDVSGNGIPNVNVLITSAEHAFASSLVRNVANAGADGSFLLTGIAAGPYAVIATSVAREGPSSGVLNIQVGSRDLDDLLIRMLPPVRVAGSLKAGDVADLAKVRVVLDAMDTYSDLRSSDPAGQGNTFLVNNVPPGRYRVRAEGVPDGFYTRSVMWNGDDVTDKGLTLSTSATAVEVTLARGASTVKGKLSSADGSPVPGGSVGLVPPDEKREDWGLYKTAIVGVNGEFTIRNLPPGEYAVFGYRPGADLTALQDPEYVRQVSAKATKLKVSEGQADTISVTTID
ncbi:MAG TPA: carboxypeptidase regulatory-like domain-containing protein [Bryobacteraceae bacterium]|nr:carboxypeptidase regulatory-like domain-containing protein [Bryobacteraceae bacterium]